MTQTEEQREELADQLDALMYRLSPSQQEQFADFISPAIRNAIDYFNSILANEVQ